MGNYPGGACRNIPQAGEPEGRVQKSSKRDRETHFYAEGPHENKEVTLKGTGRDYALTPEKIGAGTNIYNSYGTGHGRKPQLYRYPQGWWKMKAVIIEI